MNITRLTRVDERGPAPAWKPIGIAFAVAIALAGCSSTSPVMPAQVATDVATIGTGLLGALQASKLPVPPQATEAVADIVAVADALEQGESISAAQPLVQRVESDVNTVVASVGALPGLPPEVSTALTAAQVLLPVVEAAVHLTVPASVVAGGMTADQARAALSVDAK